MYYRQSSSSGAVDPSGQTTPAGGVDAYGRATDVNIAGQLKPGDYATDRPYATSSIYNTMMAGRQLTGTYMSIHKAMCTSSSCC